MIQKKKLIPICEEFSTLCDTDAVTARAAAPPLWGWVVGVDILHLSFEQIRACAHAVCRQLKLGFMLYKTHACE
jgi:hypothetical protein